MSYQIIKEKKTESKYDLKICFLMDIIIGCGQKMNKGRLMKKNLKIYQAMPPLKGDEELKDGE